MKTLKSLKAELLADPATRAEYDALAPEFVVGRNGLVLQLPTPEEDATITAAANADPDAMPGSNSDWGRVKREAAADAPIPHSPEDGPYDPNDPAAVDAHWREVNITRGPMKR